MTDWKLCFFKSIFPLSLKWQIKYMLPPPPHTQKRPDFCHLIYIRLPTWFRHSAILDSFYEMENFPQEQRSRAEIPQDKTTWQGRGGSCLHFYGRGETFFTDYCWIPTLDKALQMTAPGWQKVLFYSVPDIPRAKTRRNIFWLVYKKKQSDIK